MNILWTQKLRRKKEKHCDYFWKIRTGDQITKLAATLGLRPFGLSSATIRDDQDLNSENNNVNDSEDNVDREIEESKRFFSRFPPVAHHNNPMVQYSHLGKKYEIVFSSF